METQITAGMLHPVRAANASKRVRYAFTAIAIRNNVAAPTIDKRKMMEVSAITNAAGSRVEAYFTTRTGALYV